MTDPTVAATIEAEAARLGVEPATLAAVISVESAGRMTARVKGRDEPLIRFEGHWFDRRLDGAKRSAARKAGLADPRAGVVKNPASQPARWALLERAIRIDRAAAFESVSWGAGQVMGGNWKMLGYASVDDLVDEARAGAAGQVRLMGRFIAASGLAPALRERDWAAFARGYNGPAFRANAYDRKLARAYARFTAGVPVPRTDVLAKGARGETVADLQRMLVALGHPLSIDGIYGPATVAAVTAFQRDRNLAADGVVGPATRAALAAALPDNALALLWRRIVLRLAALFGWH